MPPSRPISPVEQLNMLSAIDEETTRQRPEPKKEEVEVKILDTNFFRFSKTFSSRPALLVLHHQGCSIAHDRPSIVGAIRSFLFAHRC